jgi:hypothetical protein
MEDQRKFLALVSIMQLVFPAREAEWQSVSDEYQQSPAGLVARLQKTLPAAALELRLTLPQLLILASVVVDLPVMGIFL